MSGDAQRAGALPATLLGPYLHQSLVTVNASHRSDATRAPGDLYDAGATISIYVLTYQTTIHRLSGQRTADLFPQRGKICVNA